MMTAFARYEPIERRLHDIAHALEDFEGHGPPEVAAYCNRLNKLVSAVLVNAAPTDLGTGVESLEQELAQRPPRMRRR